jgi:hypothetical protein
MMVSCATSFAPLILRGIVFVLDVWIAARPSANFLTLCVFAFDISCTRTVSLCRGTAFSKTQTVFILPALAF